MPKKNIGEEKHYKYIYKGVKRDFRISKDVIEKEYVDNMYLNHFYTQNEKNKFLEKWKDNIE